MATFHGMDISEVRSHAAHLNLEAGRLAETLASINGIMLGNWWVGPDARHMVEKWNGEIAPAIGAARDFLNEMARLMTQQAQDQEAVSAE